MSYTATVGLGASTKRTSEVPANDPDADLRKWLREWFNVNARKGCRREWADLRAAGWVVNKKKVQ